MEIGDKVYCKFSNYSYTENKEYIILDVVPTKYLISSNSEFKYYFDKIRLKIYFYTLKEKRKEKLDKINGKKHTIAYDYEVVVEQPNDKIIRKRKLEKINN